MKTQIMILLLLLTLFPSLLFAQYLPINQRYQEIEHFLAHQEYQEKIEQHLVDIFSFKDITNHIEKKISQKLSQEHYIKSLNHFLIRVSYEPEITHRIQKIFLKLLKDNLFKQGILLIIKEQRKDSVIYSALKNHIQKQFQNDPQGVALLKLLGESIFQCSYNRQKIAEAFGKGFLHPNIRTKIREEILNYPFPPKDLDRLKQRIVMLGFKHTINNWLDPTLSKTASAIKIKLNTPELRAALTSPQFEHLITEAISRWLNKDETVEDFKNYLIPLIDKNQLYIERFLYRLIVNQKKPFEVIKTLNIPCYQIKLDHFSLSKNLLLIYLKQLLVTTKIQKELIPLFFKYLK